MTPAMAELLHHHRRTIAELRQQVELMQMYLRGEGGFGTREGANETTEDSISRTEEQIDRLERLIAKHDPEGLTALV